MPELQHLHPYQPANDWQAPGPFRSGALSTPTHTGPAPTSPRSPALSMVRGQCAPSETFIDRPSKQPNFLQKLYAFLALDPHPCPEVIYWATDSQQLVIAQPDKLVRDVLPKLFKHDKLASFGRQLNIYGFSRLFPGKQFKDAYGNVSDASVWAHPTLHRLSTTAELSQIKRRAAPKLFRTRRLANGQVIRSRAGPNVVARAIEVREEIADSKRRRTGNSVAYARSAPGPGPNVPPSPNLAQLGERAGQGQGLFGQSGEEDGYGYCQRVAAPAIFGGGGGGDGCIDGGQEPGHGGEEHENDDPLRSRSTGLRTGIVQTTPAHPSLPAIVPCTHTYAYTPQLDFISPPTPTPVLHHPQPIFARDYAYRQQSDHHQHQDQHQGREQGSSLTWTCPAYPIEASGSGSCGSAHSVDGREGIPIPTLGGAENHTHVHGNVEYSMDSASTPISSQQAAHGLGMANSVNWTWDHHNPADQDPLTPLHQSSLSPPLPLPYHPTNSTRLDTFPPSNAQPTSLPYQGSGSSSLLPSLAAPFVAPAPAPAGLPMRLYHSCPASIHTSPTLGSTSTSSSTNAWAYPSAAGSGDGSIVVPQTPQQWKAFLNHNRSSAQGQLLVQSQSQKHLPVLPKLVNSPEPNADDSAAASSSADWARAMSTPTLPPALRIRTDVTNTEMPAMTTPSSVDGHDVHPHPDAEQHAITGFANTSTSATTHDGEGVSKAHLSYLTAPAPAPAHLFDLHDDDNVNATPRPRPNSMALGASSHSHSHSRGEDRWGCTHPSGPAPASMSQYGSPTEVRQHHHNQKDSAQVPAPTCTSSYTTTTTTCIETTTAAAGIVPSVPLAELHPHAPAHTHAPPTPPITHNGTIDPKWISPVGTTFPTPRMSPVSVSVSGPPSTGEMERAISLHPAFDSGPNPNPNPNPYSLDVGVGVGSEDVRDAPAPETRDEAHPAQAAPAQEHSHCHTGPQTQIQEAQQTLTLPAFNFFYPTSQDAEHWSSDFLSGPIF